MQNKQTHDDESKTSDTDLDTVIVQVALHSFMHFGSFQNFPLDLDEGLLGLNMKHMRASVNISIIKNHNIIYLHVTWLSHGTWPVGCRTHSDLSFVCDAALHIQSDSYSRIDGTCFPCFVCLTACSYCSVSYVSLADLGLLHTLVPTACASVALAVKSVMIFWKSLERKSESALSMTA